MFGGAIESDQLRRDALAYADRRGGRAACEEYGDGGEDTDAEVGFCGERGREVLQLEHQPEIGVISCRFEPRPSGTGDHHLTIIPEH